MSDRADAVALAWHAAERLGPERHVSHVRRAHHCRPDPRVSGRRRVSGQLCDANTAGAWTAADPEIRETCQVVRA